MAASLPTYSPDFAERFDGSALLSDEPGAQGWINRRLSHHWRRTSAEAFGEDRAEATLLKVAHERALKIEREQVGGRGVTGSIVSERVGKTQRQWGSKGSKDQGVAVGSDKWWRLSDYGSAYLTLRDEACGSGPDWGLA